MNLYLRHFFRSILLGLVIFVVLLVVNLTIGSPVKTDLVWLLSSLGFTLIYTVAIYMANMVLFVRLNKVFKHNRFSKKRLLIGFASSFFLSLCCFFLLRIFEDVVVEGETLQQFFKEESPLNYLVAVVITMFITLAVHAFYFYRQLQEARVAEQRVIAGTASAQFESLKNQIDPHFLFNSLNVLSSLIEENPENAQRFTTSLSKIYRYVLEQKNKEYVTLQEELNFASTYMKLLKMRFENSLEYKLPEGPIDPDAKVVPLALQLLLENTVKHNVVSEKNPLRIEIRVEGDYLVIENNLQKKDVIGAGKGVGLQNIISRYAILTRRQVNVEERDGAFKVKIPILTQIVSVMETIEKHDNMSYFRAQKKVEEIKGFYGHLVGYIFTIVVLAVINFVTSPQFLWFFFPMLGWGVGVLIHGLSVFNYMPFFGCDWEERKIREFMEKEKSAKRK